MRCVHPEPEERIEPNTTSASPKYSQNARSDLAADGEGKPALYDLGTESPAVLHSLSSKSPSTPGKIDHLGRVVESKHLWHSEMWSN